MEIKPMKTASLAALAALAAFVFAGAGTSQGAVIMYVGDQANVDSSADDGATIGWHSTANVKPLDIDGDNALGSDGWIRANNGSSGTGNPRRLLPGYIAPYNRTTFATAALLGFANSASGDSAGVMDSPATGGLNINPATEDAFAAWHSNNGSDTGLFAFTIQNANLLAGQTLRVGVLFDASNGGTGSQVMSITQSAGGSATATSGSLAHAGDGLDVAFFDLTGLANGDRFVIAADSTSRSHIAGVTWDSAIAIPEPSAALLSGLGLLALLRRRRA